MISIKIKITLSKKKFSVTFYVFNGENLLLFKMGKNLEYKQLRK